MAQDLGAIDALRIARSTLRPLVTSNLAIKKFGGGLRSKELDKIEELYNSLNKLVVNMEKTLKDLKPENKVK